LVLHHFGAYADSLGIGPRCFQAMSSQCFFELRLALLQRQSNKTLAGMRALSYPIFFVITNKDALETLIKGR
jgi:hypothetical protein